MMESLDGRVSGIDFRALFNKEAARIPMRDGVELYTEIYVPKNHEEALPFIYERTPYGIGPDRYGYSSRLRSYPELVAEGYIFVFQDTRGRGASDGRHLTVGPLRDRSLANSADDSTDAYDSIEWLVKHVRNNNGRVGTLGISYNGFLVTRALINPHPALRAASPQATCADMFVGDNWHHNGAFRLDYAFAWIADVEAGLTRGSELINYDHYDRFLNLGPLADVNQRIFHGTAPSWNMFAQHPNLDRFWLNEHCAVLPNIQSVSVPTFNVLGWFDAEDLYGPLKVYQKYESLDRKGLNYLVIGPWYHGGWSRSPDGRVLRAIDFGQDTSRWFRDKVQARWFAYWLKDQGALDFPEVMAFRTGENCWERYDSWPPKPNGISERRLYLHANGRLSFDSPTEVDARGHDDYVSDPSKPVPHYPRPITGDGWPEWQEADQRFVDGRPDVLTYQSDPLPQEMTITGDTVAHLFAATTGSDSDWIVKLIDMYPDPYGPDPHMSGYQFMVTGEVLRARYRNSFERPEAVVPREITAYQIHLRDRDHTFKAGHRIMVQIQSSWFPLIDRNPQRFVRNIYEAVEADYQRAKQSVLRSREHPSYLSLPVNAQAAEPLPADLEYH